MIAPRVSHLECNDEFIASNVGAQPTLRWSPAVLQRSSTAQSGNAVHGAVHTCMLRGRRRPRVNRMVGNAAKVPDEGHAVGACSAALIRQELSAPAHTWCVGPCRVDWGRGRRRRCSAKRWHLLRPHTTSKPSGVPLWAPCQSLANTSRASRPCSANWQGQARPEPMRTAAKVISPQEYASRAWWHSWQWRHGGVVVGDCVGLARWGRTISKGSPVSSVPVGGRDHVGIIARGMGPTISGFRAQEPCHFTLA
jgi:hypothetical protein